METISKEGNEAPSNEIIGSNYLNGIQLVFISTFEIAICIAAILGNILFLIALRKVSSRVLGPPSIIFFGCLACTDLGVAIFLQPLRIAFYHSRENSETCKKLHLRHELSLSFYVDCLLR